MFKNEYNDSFGKTYTSAVWDKAQKANGWSLAYTLLYALSKNGMKYATAKSGSCSVINETSLGCSCQIVASGPTATSGSLIITFKRLCLKINVVTSSDEKKAYPSGIFITDLEGKTLATLCKCSGTTGGKFVGSEKMSLYDTDYDAITNWSNNPDVDEDKYKVQTSTFKDANGSYDAVCLHFWAEDIDLGSIMIFKAKDYFSSNYKYGFYMYKSVAQTVVMKFSDDTEYSIHTAFSDAGPFPSRTASLCFFTGSSFSGVIGGNNGVYIISDGTSGAITNGSTGLRLSYDNKVSINGRDFQFMIAGLYARTS